MNPHRSWIVLATVAALSGTGALSTAGSGPQLPTRWILIYAGSPKHHAYTVQFQGTSYRVATPTGRLNLVGAYVRAVRTRFSAGAFRHLVLYGLYWLNERVEAQDRGIIAATASVVHDAGLKFLWIPYYMAN